MPSMGLPSSSTLLPPLLLLYVVLPLHASARPNCSPAYGTLNSTNCGLAIDLIASNLTDGQTLTTPNLFVRNASVWNGVTWADKYSKVQLDKTWTHEDCTLTLTFNNLSPPPADYNTPVSLLGGQDHTETWSTVQDLARFINGNCTTQQGTGGRLIFGEGNSLSLSLVSTSQPLAASIYDQAFQTCDAYAKTQLTGSSKQAADEAYSTLRLVVSDPDNPKPPQDDAHPNKHRRSLALRRSIWDLMGDFWHTLTTAYTDSLTGYIQTGQNGLVVRVCKQDSDCVAQCGMKCEDLRSPGGVDVSLGGWVLGEVGHCRVSLE